MPTVLITGAASGIGRAAARRFAGAGWRCELVDRDGDGLARVRAALPGEHDAHVIDLTDTARIRVLAARPGRIDAVVNNAGMSDPRGVPLVDQGAEDQARLAALNLEAPAAVVAAVESRLAPRARIVAVASGAGLRAIPLRGWYSATKAGLIAQSRALARARPGLVVTVLCPGFVRTDLVDRLITEGRLDVSQAVARIPLGRMAEPEDMAEALWFLASEDAAPISGEIVRVCGGSSVYGGSRACEPARDGRPPLDASLALIIRGDDAGAWAAALERTASRLRAAADLEAADGPSPAAYRAVVDASPLEHRTSPTLVARVHESARRFAADHGRDASLTLLLPREPSGGTDDWMRAGDCAAAHMLVATLACELAPRALRVNALVMDPGDAPARLAGLVRHLAGPASTFVTGQVLSTTRAQHI